MATNDYIPARDDQKSTWAKSFKDNLPEAAVILKLTAEEITGLQDQCTTIINSVATNDLAQTAAKQATSVKNTSVNKSVSVLRKGVAAIKTNQYYTDGMGKLLKIIGTDSPVDPSTYQPDMKAEVFLGHVTLRFTKHGVDGVNVYERLKGQPVWTKLSFDSHSPYVDNRPLAVPGVPEVREYMCIGVLHDEEIGQPSDVVVVTFGG